MLRKRSDVKTQARRKVAEAIKKLKQLKSKGSKSKGDKETWEGKLKELLAPSKCSKPDLPDMEDLDS